MYRQPQPASPGDIPPIVPRRPLRLLAVVALTGLAGCGGAAPPTAETSAIDTGVMAKDSEAAVAVQEAINKAINDTTIAYAPVSYKYNEDFLDKLDRIEAYLAGRPGAEAPRFLTENLKEEIAPIPAEEEVAHYRETFRRWAEATKKDARKEIDALKAIVAAYKPGDRDHRDFHKAFSAVFDDWRNFEVEEMRERRNVEIHRRAREAFAPYRESHPDLVKSFEAMLDDPQYKLPKGADKP